MNNMGYIRVQKMSTINLIEVGVTISQIPKKISLIYYSFIIFIVYLYRFC